MSVNLLLLTYINPDLSQGGFTLIHSSVKRCIASEKPLVFGQGAIAK